MRSQEDTNKTNEKLIPFLLCKVASVFNNISLHILLLRL